jgi:hypothetical protein
MDRASGKHGEKRNAYKVVVGKREDLGVDGKII